MSGLARAIWNALAVVVLTVGFCVPALLYLPFSRGRGVSPIARRWGRAVLFATGVEVEVEGPAAPLDAPAYLVMANHTSHFDVVCLYATLPLDVRPVAKQELAWVPVFGWVLALGAAIMIDRRSHARALASIARAAETIRGGGSVLMFPEGTRTPPGQLGPLKKGPFHLALAAGVPVLPVGLEGTGAVLLSGDWRIRPGRVRLRLGAPIPAPPGAGEGVEDRPEVRAALTAQVDGALRALMGPTPSFVEVASGER